MSEIMEWAGDLDTILTPDKLNPTKIKDFPAAREAADRLKCICKWKADELKEKMQKIEDVVMDKIESTETILRMTGGGMPVTKKKYNSADKRARELRLRLSTNDEYNQLAKERQQWEIMYSDWVSHGNRLRQDMRLLEINYASNGGEGSGI